NSSIMANCLSAILKTIQWMKTRIKSARPMKMSKKIWIVIQMMTKLKNAAWWSGKRLPVSTTAANRNAEKKNATVSTGWLKKNQIRRNRGRDQKAVTGNSMMTAEEIKTHVKSPIRATFVRY